MTPIFFSDGILKKYPVVWDYAEQSVLSRIVLWVLHSNQRTATRLSDWLRQQVINPVPCVIATAAKIVTGDSYDDTALVVRAWVEQNIKYVSDQERWNVPDYWATAEETLSKTTYCNGITFLPREGDCEDGAILMYVLCRLKGVPANRLLLWCGDTIDGGHCCLFYKPSNYPLSFVSLDWCYYSIPDAINNRNLFDFSKKSIREYHRDDLKLKNSNYLSSWFFWNEDTGYESFVQQPGTEVLS